MVLVDTNIIAPLYVRSARTDAVEELFARDAVWRTEPLALIELNNVLITYARARYITAATARDCLNRAAAFLQRRSIIGLQLTTRAFSPWQINSGAAWSPKTPDCAPPRPP